jgi:hypothetical protein
VAVMVGGRLVTEDAPDTREPDPTAPALVDDGVQTADHIAEYADGAAAVIIDGTATSGRAITSHGLRSSSAAGGTSLAIEVATHGVVRGAGIAVVTDSAVAAAIYRRGGIGLETSGVRPVLASGSTPSGDGLRVLVDTFHTAPNQSLVVRPGPAGQVAWAELGPAPA